MNNCRICGKELWNIHDRVCENTRCFVEYELSKKKKLEKLLIYHEVIVNPENKKVFSLFPSRPWSSTCVDNLHINMEKKWSAEKSSEETKRKLDEIKYMQRVIKKVGYSNLKKVLLKIEKAKGNVNISREIEWLREIGILNFFDFQIKNTSASTSEAITK
ncbi:MAG: hypothetical protein WC337_03445 [Candidatus Muiribacteriota bacterium]|jgi:hypothetical protein